MHPDVTLSSTAPHPTLEPKEEYTGTVIALGTTGPHTSTTAATALPPSSPPPPATSSLDYTVPARIRVVLPGSRRPVDLPRSPPLGSSAVQPHATEIAATALEPRTIDDVPVFTFRLNLPSGDNVLVTPRTDSTIDFSCTVDNDCDIIITMFEGEPLEATSQPRGTVTAMSISDLLENCFPGGFSVSRFVRGHDEDAGPNTILAGSVKRGQCLLLRSDNSEILALHSKEGSCLKLFEK
jgi:hypothetical protein